MAKESTAEPMDVLTRLTIALEAMAAKQQTDPAATLVIEKLTEAVDRMAVNQKEGAEKVADATLRQGRRSNEVVPMRSVFNPRGILLEEYQKPKLKCTMMLPWLAENDSLTREEVELLNLL